MVARVWHGQTLASRADQYAAYLSKTAVPDVLATPGNQGVYILRKVQGDRAHFLLVSLWESLEVIKAFAGDDVEEARYYSEDPDFLVELEPTVPHYEVIAHQTPGASSY